MIYNPDHPALHGPRMDILEPHLTVRQSEILIQLWNDGWRMKDLFPRFTAGGMLNVLAEKTSPGGPDGEGVKWVLEQRITSYGGVLDRREFDE
jgi:hypothetical protein